MTVPLHNSNRNYLIYADALSSVWSWWDMVTDPSYALRQELDLWEILHRDPKTRQGIDQRLNDVAGREWRVLPGMGSQTRGAKLKAAIMTAMLKRLPHFSDARRRQAQAIFRGSARQLIMGRREMCSLADMPAMYWFVPTGLKHMDPRRFVIRPLRNPKPDGSTEVKAQLYMSVIPTYQTGAAGKDLWYGRYVPVRHPEWLLQTIYDDEESRLGHGRGIMDAMYFYHWAKQVSLREGLQGLERWAQGVAVYKFDPKLYGLADGTQSTEQIRDKALEQLAKMRSRHFFAANIGEELDVHTEGQQGGRFVLDWIEYLDRCIIAVATGASLRSSGDVGAAGGFASDSVGQDLMETAVGFDREVIGEDIKLDLIGHLCTVNRPQFKALGDLIGVPDLAEAPDPDFIIVHKKRVDPVAAMGRFVQAMQIPEFRVKKAEIYEEQGWTQPEEDDQDVFEGKAPPMIDPETGLPIPDQDGQDPNVDPNQDPQETGGEPGPETQEDLFTSGVPETDQDLFADPVFLEQWQLEQEQRIMAGGGAGIPDNIYSDAGGMEELELSWPAAAPGAPDQESENKVTTKVGADETTTGTSGPTHGKTRGALVRPHPSGSTPNTQEPSKGAPVEVDGRKRGRKSGKVETNL